MLVEVPGLAVPPHLQRDRPLDDGDLHAERPLSCHARVRESRQDPNPCRHRVVVDPERALSDVKAARIDDLLLRERDGSDDVDLLEAEDAGTHHDPRPRRDSRDHDQGDDDPAPAAALLRAYFSPALGDPWGSDHPIRGANHLEPPRTPRSASVRARARPPYPRAPSAGSGGARCRRRPRARRPRPR